MIASSVSENEAYDDPTSELLLTDISASGSTIPKNDGIDYLQDVNIAGQDIIHLLKTTHDNIERSLSRAPESSSIESSNIDKSFLPQHQKSAHVIDPDEAENAGFEGIGKAGEHFLKNFQFLIEYTEKRINVSPTEQQEQDRKLRHALRSSRKTEMEIKSLKDSLESEKMEHKKLIDKLNGQLTECENKSDRREEEMTNLTSKIINESEMNMIEFYKESLLNQELLNSEIKIVRNKLNNLRANNIRMENELRNKRCSVETELLNCLSKYDREIGDRHREMENLTTEFELLNLQRKTLENDVMINLRQLHDDLQHEKAEALLKIRNAKVEKFVRNRAAIVIQKAWRGYWERHCAKKKKKSRKNK